MCKAQQLKQEIQEKDWSKAVIVQDQDSVFLKYNGNKTNITVPLNNITRNIKSPRALLAYAIQIAIP